MNDLREAAQQALDALYDIDATGVPVGHIDLVIDTLKAALAQQEQRLVLVPEGLAQSDAELWLDKRAAIIDACGAQGFTIVTTANGVHLMRLGKIEAKTAAQAQQEQEPPEQPIDYFAVQRIANERGLDYNRFAAALRDYAALAQQEPEPVAWQVHPFDYGIGFEGVYAMTQLTQQRDSWIRKGWKVTPLYAHPPRREWQSLTDEEIQRMGNETPGQQGGWNLAFARAVEAALKERNT